MRISDFATEVLNIIGRGADNVDSDLSARLLPAATPANNPGIVNRAIMRIARNWAWKELRILDLETFDTTDGQRYVDLDSIAPIREIVDVRLIDGANSRKLVRVEDIWLKDKYIPDPTQIAEGRAVRYSESYITIGSSNHLCLVLDPIPDAVYDINLRYSKWPDTYTANQSPEIFNIDDVILNLSTSMGYAYIGEYPQAGFWYRNEYMPALKEAVKLQISSPDWDPIWLGHTSPPDLGRGFANQPWRDPFFMGR